MRVAPTAPNWNGSDFPPTKFRDQFEIADQALEKHEVAIYVVQDLEHLHEPGDIDKEIHNEAPGHRKLRVERQTISNPVQVHEAGDCA